MNKKIYFLGIFSLVLILASVAIVLNRVWLYDLWRGLNYSPSNEMVSIREDLSLTDRGNFLFNASHPELDESNDFNTHCKTNDESAIAILGCYTEGNIYVYNIIDPELDGIRELTTAHELLHAVYVRMSESEKQEIGNLLETIPMEDQTSLNDEISTYGSNEKAEELYVRAGTEIKNLPNSLEKHYAEVFKDQDKIVDFYDSYISVFREIEANMKTLETEMQNINNEIETKTTDYEKTFKQLEADIISFNACAEVAGCFKTEEEFNSKREDLINRQNALNDLYGEINNLVNEYNTRVNEYNENVVKSRKLNQKINSNSRPDNLTN